MSVPDSPAPVDWGRAPSVGYAVRNTAEASIGRPWSRRVFTHHLDAAIGWRCSVKPAMAHSLVRTTRTQCLPLSLTRARGGSRWIAAVCQSAALPFDAQPGICVNSFTGQVTARGEGWPGAAVPLRGAIDTEHIQHSIA